MCSSDLVIDEPKNFFSDFCANHQSGLNDERNASGADAKSGRKTGNEGGGTKFFQSQSTKFLDSFLKSFFEEKLGSFFESFVGDSANEFFRDDSTELSGDAVPELSANVALDGLKGMSDGVEDLAGAAGEKAGYLI